MSRRASTTGKGGAPGAGAPSRRGALRRLAAAVALGTLVAACGDRSPAEPASGPARRIVSLTCAGTDVFAALGALDRLVAVEEDCPCAGTERIEKVRNEDHPGKVTALNLESVLALRPDAVLAKPDLRAAFEGRGLRVVYTLPEITYENVPDLVHKVGDLLGRADDAEALLARMRAKEAALRERTKDLPRVSVYYEGTGIGGTVGSKSIIHAMIALAGGRSIAGDVEKPSVSLTPEAIFAADPDVIVLGAFADAPVVVKARPGWERLRAVREGRVFQIPVERRAVALGTPRCVDGCEEMLLPWLHPEVATAPGGR